MKKTKKSKSSEAKTSSILSGQDQDLLGLLTVLVEKLTSFETKLDLVLNRLNWQSLPKPVNASTPQKPLTPLVQQEQRYHRPMYKAVCADCRSLCQIPFKPVPGRPVYCQSCYSLRKSANVAKTFSVEKTKDLTPVYAQAPLKPKTSESVKQAMKKSAQKKKVKRK